MVGYTHPRLGYPTALIPYLLLWIPYRNDIGPTTRKGPWHQRYPTPPPPIVNRLTETCENITFPQLMLRALITPKHLHKIEEDFGETYFTLQNALQLPRLCDALAWPYSAAFVNRCASTDQILDLPLIVLLEGWIPMSRRYGQTTSLRLFQGLCGQIK